MASLEMTTDAKETNETFSEWLQSVELGDYEQKLIDVGIKSKTHFGAFSSKEKLEKLIEDNVKLDKPGHISIFAAAYDSLHPQSAQQEILGKYLKSQKENIKLREENAKYEDTIANVTQIANNSLRRAAKGLKKEQQRKSREAASKQKNQTLEEKIADIKDKNEQTILKRRLNNIQNEKKIFASFNVISVISCLFVLIEFSVSLGANSGNSTNINVYFSQCIVLIISLLFWFIIKFKPNGIIKLIKCKYFDCMKSLDKTNVWMINQVLNSIFNFIAGLLGIFNYSFVNLDESEVGSVLIIIFLFLLIFILFLLSINTFTFPFIYKYICFCNNFRKYSFISYCKNPSQTELIALHNKISEIQNDNRKHQEYAISLAEVPEEKNRENDAIFDVTNKQDGNNNDGITVESTILAESKAAKQISDSQPSQQMSLASNSVTAGYSAQLFLAKKILGALRIGD